MTFGCLLGLTRLLLCGLLMPRVIVVQDQPPPPPPANPGFAACSYSGGCGETTNPPGLQALPVEQLPPECTSLFFDGLRVNKTFSIGPARGDSDNVVIQNLGKSAKPFYSFYARSSFREWMDYLGKDGLGRNPQEEIVRLTEYLKTVNIKGLVLKNLSLPICTKPSLASEWCADNSTTYRLKGKKYGMGFMMNNVDLNDAKNECQCQKPFWSFYNVLDGWTTAPPSQPCQRFDRTFNTSY